MASINQRADQLVGVIGFFDQEKPLIDAMAKVRSENYRYFDAFTPYPVHGLDSAQGLKRSSLPFVTLAAGLTGCSLGFLLQFWTSAVDWPINVAGKPLNSWPAFIPVTFEVTVLFAGLATVAAMFVFNGLPNLKRKVFDPRITQDRFAIVIEATLATDDPEAQAALAKKGKSYKVFQESEAAKLLQSLGAVEVKSVYSEGWF